MITMIFTLLIRIQGINKTRKLRIHFDHFQIILLTCSVHAESWEKYFRNGFSCHRPVFGNLAISNVRSFCSHVCGKWRILAGWENDYAYAMLSWNHTGGIWENNINMLTVKYFKKIPLSLQHFRVYSIIFTERFGHFPFPFNVLNPWLTCGCVCFTLTLLTTVSERMSFLFWTFHSACVSLNIVFLTSLILTSHVMSSLNQSDYRGEIKRKHLVGSPYTEQH